LTIQCGVPFNWKQAASFKLPVRPAQEIDILAQSRKLCVQAGEAVRLQITIVGQVVKAM
jgi:hypothetical protein